MAKVNALLNERLKKSEPSPKMAALAKQSAEGTRGSFSGVFSLGELNENEKLHIEAILNEYATGKQEIEGDLHSLIAITSEVKGINNQAALLHGERIKKAQAILTQYKEGAFTSWLLAAYGNRQTPYNFLQYFEFYEALPKILKERIDLMPRQAIYTLASREGALDKKFVIIENYRGENKSEMLRIIRETFPLKARDKRGANQGDNVLNLLNRAALLMKASTFKPTKQQQGAIQELLTMMLHDE